MFSTIFAGDKARRVRVPVHFSTNKIISYRKQQHDERDVGLY